MGNLTYEVLGLPEDTEPVNNILKKYAGYEKNLENPEMYFVVGGDGAILFYKDLLLKKEKPVVKVGYKKGSLKSLQFARATTLEDLKLALDEILNENYFTRKEELLKCTINGKYYGLAINEVNIKTAPIEIDEHEEWGKIYSHPSILFKVNINKPNGENETLPSPKCDGIMFSTPYGSTAWGTGYTSPITGTPSIIITIYGSPIKQEHFVHSIDANISADIHARSLILVDGKGPVIEENSHVGIERSNDYINFLYPKSTESVSERIRRQIDYSWKHL